MTADMLVGLGLLIPELILIVMALVLLLLARRTRGTQVPLALTLAAALTSAGFAGATLGAGATTGFGGMIVQDGYAQFFEVLIAMALLVGALLSTRSVQSDKIPRAEFHALLLLASAGMMISVSSLDLLPLYLGLELTTLCSYVLVGIRVDRPNSNEAAIKYFLLGSFASAVLLMGISLIYGLSGTTEFEAIASALSAPEVQQGPLLGIAVSLIAGGLAFKIAAVPFHAWAPDAYEGAAAPVAAFMASGPKAAGLAVSARPGLGERVPDHDPDGARRRLDRCGHCRRPVPDQHEATARLLVHCACRLRPVGPGRRNAGRRDSHHDLRLLLRVHDPGRLRRGRRPGVSGP